MKEHQIVKARKRLAIFNAISSVPQCLAFLLPGPPFTSVPPICTKRAVPMVPLYHPELWNDMDEKRAYLLYQSFVYAGSVFRALVIPAAFERRPQLKSTYLQLPATLIIETTINALFILIYDLLAGALWRSTSQKVRSLGGATTLHSKEGKNGRALGLSTHLK